MLVALPIFAPGYAERARLWCTKLKTQVEQGFSRTPHKEKSITQDDIFSWQAKTRPFKNLSGFGGRFVRVSYACGDQRGGKFLWYHDSMNSEYKQNHESAQDFKFDKERTADVKLPEKKVVEEINNNATEEEKSVESQANYQGYWDDALYERLNNQEIKAQFVINRMHYAKGMSDLNPGDMLQKKEETSDYYISQVAKYEENLSKAFSYVEHVPSANKNREAKHLGVSSYGEYATLFQDAAKDGKELTARQKNIILAHELGHSVRDYQGEDAQDIRKSVDLSKIENPQIRNYLNKPEEIIERMSQLKNYFGMKGSEKFTKEHLYVAKQNYLKDTELDNNMKEFFESITPETEDSFIEVINKFGV